jgi:hypothetical protein
MDSIKIGEKELKVTKHENFDTGYRMYCDDGTVVAIFKNRQDAGMASKAFWLATAAQKPFYFMEVIGRGHTNPYAAAADIFLKWNMNLPAGPGVSKPKSFMEWLDLFEKEPHYGKESDCEISYSLSKELKFPKNVVCYTDM